METLDYDGVQVSVPTEMLDDRLSFKQIVSLDTWNNLQEQQRQHLMKFLPDFRGVLNPSSEHTETVNMLFGGDNFLFGNPRDQFLDHARLGFLTQPINNLRQWKFKMRHKNARLWRQSYMDSLLKSLLVGCKTQLNRAISSPGVSETSPSNGKDKGSHLIERVKNRYFRELRRVRAEVYLRGKTDDDRLSPDDTYPEGPAPALSRKYQRYLLRLESSLTGEHTLLSDTMSRRSQQQQCGLALAEDITADRNPYQVSELRYHELLIQRRRHRPLQLQDSVDTKSSHRDSWYLDSLLKSSSVGSSCSDDTDLSDLDAEGDSSEVYLPAAEAASLSNLSPPGPSQAAAVRVGVAPPAPLSTWQPVIGRLHSCFFSLLRDVICSDAADRMSAAEVGSAVVAWSHLTVAPLNDWYSDVPDWNASLHSALAFLSGEVKELLEKKDLVPFLDHNLTTDMYQWIGAGRDSNTHLQSLFGYWTSIRNECRQKVDTFLHTGNDAGLARDIQPKLPAALSPVSTTTVQRARGGDKRITYRRHCPASPAPAGSSLLKPRPTAAAASPTSRGPGRVTAAAASPTSRGPARSTAATASPTSRGPARATAAAASPTSHGPALSTAAAASPTSRGPGRATAAAASPTSRGPARATAAAASTTSHGPALSTAAAVSPTSRGPARPTAAPTVVVQRRKARELGSLSQTELAVQSILYGPAVGGGGLSTVRVLSSAVSGNTGDAPAVPRAQGTGAAMSPLSAEASTAPYSTVTKPI